MAKLASRIQTSNEEETYGWLEQISGMRESWRSSEEAPFIEAMNEKFQRALLFGDSSKDPEQIMGLTPRFATKTATKAKNAVNVIDALGTGSDLTSIWLVGWSPNTVHCIYPENSTAGLKKTDLGEEAAYDDDGGEERAGIIVTLYGEFMTVAPSRHPGETEAYYLPQPIPEEALSALFAEGDPLPF